MTKERHKKTFFDALDKQKVDKQVVPLCKFLSFTKNYFSSSTCSGRIVLLNVDEVESKKKAAFHAKWHRKTGFAELWKALNKKTQNEIWFKMEPFILHIGTNTIENAQKLLEICRTVGIKRGGIQVLKDGKISFEITGTQHISCPVKKENKIIVDKKYLKFLLAKANKKLAKNYAQLKVFEKECKKKLK